MRFSKVALSPVVATALLLVVAVVSVVGFQGWFTSFSSGLMVDVESDTTSSVSAVSVSGIIGNELYLNSKLDDVDVNSLKVLDSSGAEICEFSAQVNDSNLDLGLIAYWKLNDKNLTLKDYSGNNYDATLYGISKGLFNFNSGSLNDKSNWDYNVSFDGVNFDSSNCINGDCAKFDSDFGNITIDNFSNFMFEDSFSVSAWFKKNSLNTSWQRLFDFGDIVSGGGNTGIGLNLYSNFPAPVNSSGKMNLGFYKNYSDVSSRELSIAVFEDSFINDTNWHHVVVTFDKNNYKVNFYLDNELKKVNYWTDEIGPGGYQKASSIGVNHSDVVDFSNFVYLIGDSLWSGDKSFNGSIDEIGFYSKVLGSSEVNKLYNSKISDFVEFGDDFVEFDGVSSYAKTNYFPDSNVKSFYVKMNIQDTSDSEQRLGVHDTNNHRLYLGSNRNIFYAGYGNYYHSYQNFDFRLDNYYNKFVDYVLSYNGTDVNTYLNGDFISNFSASFSGASLEPFVIGAAYYGVGNALPSSYIKGKISEIRIYDRELNQTEIKSLSWKNFKSLNKGVSKLDLSGCNLSSNSKYEIVGTTKNGLFNYEVVSR